MGLVDPIRSSGNSRLKAVRALKSGRDREHLLLEGEHLLEEALAASVALDWVLYAEGDSTAVRQALLEQAASAGAEVVPCDSALMREASHLTTPPGVLAWGPKPNAELAAAFAELAAGKPLLVSAGVQDPGNVGALVRVAAGLGAAGFVSLKGGASPWHPRALRGSSGTVFRLPVADTVDAADFLQLAQTHQVECWAADASGVDAQTLSAEPRVALVMGEEGGGIDAALLEACTQTVGIPLQRGVESLNVAAAAAVLLHGIARHRA